jgi:ketopantoate reductase
MNPVEAVMGAVCGTCVRENHANAVSQQRADRILRVAHEEGTEAGRKAFLETVKEILNK